MRHLDRHKIPQHDDTFGLERRKHEYKTLTFTRRMEGHHKQHATESRIGQLVQILYGLAEREIA